MMVPLAVSKEVRERESVGGKDEFHFEYLESEVLLRQSGEDISMVSGKSCWDSRKT